MTDNTHGQVPADTNTASGAAEPGAMQAATLSAYAPADQAFYKFWYGHMLADLMQPPQVGMSHTTARYIWDAALASAPAQPAPQQAPQQEAQEPVAVVVPCYTPSGKRVALYSAKQDLPIGTKLYTHPSPPEGMAAEQALLKVLAAVQRYLPPDGPSAHDTLTEIIEVVDPWPLGQLDKS